MPIEFSLLLVEDEPDVLDVFARRFGRLGYDVTAVRLPQEALDAAVNREFHVAVIDYFLPHMDGVQLMQRLKGLNAGVQVILLSGHQTPVLLDEATRGGAYGCLAKPCRFDDLKQLVEQALEETGRVDVPLARSQEG